MAEPVSAGGGVSTLYKLYINNYASSRETSCIAEIARRNIERERPIVAPPQSEERAFVVRFQLPITTSFTHLLSLSQTIIKQTHK